MDKLNRLIRNADDAASGLKAMAHELRLLTLCHIGNGECSVHELERYLGTSQSNISQHLAKMRDKGILETRKDGNFVYYKIKNRDLLELLPLLQKIFC